MQLIAAGTFYLLIGAGCACVLIRRRSIHGFDAVLVLFAWPLYVPSLSGNPPDRASAPRIEREQIALSEAIAAVNDPSLAGLLPSREQLQRIVERLHALDGKVAELDAILGRDDFDPSRAPAMVRSSIETLRALRDRAAHDRDELLALCTRLRTQITVLRFAGTGTQGVSELVRDIAERIEGVGAALTPGLQSAE